MWRGVSEQRREGISTYRWNTCDVQLGPYTPELCTAYAHTHTQTRLLGRSTSLAQLLSMLSCVDITSGAGAEAEAGPRRQ